METQQLLRTALVLPFCLVKDYMPKEPCSDELQTFSSYNSQSL